MSISNQLAHFNQELPSHVTLVAVSKTKPIEDVQAAYDAGQRIFGENKVQEMTSKWERLPKDIEWHMIGHLQRNKVKYMAPYVHLVHSVDSHRLLKEIDKQAAKNDRTINVLLQVHIAQEQTKFGWEPDALIKEMTDGPILSLENINIAGLMGMATFTDNKEQVALEFQLLNNLFEGLKLVEPLTQKHSFNTLSMGMTGDYTLAIENGSTMVRIGSAIFGSR